MRDPTEVDRRRLGSYQAAMGLGLKEGPKSKSISPTRAISSRKGRLILRDDNSLTFFLRSPPNASATSQRAIPIA